VEAGPFDDTDFAQAAKEFFEEYPDGHPVVAPTGWGSSHGYEYIEQDREDGIYDWFEKRETSVLPKTVAANIYSPGPEVLKVNDLQKAALSKIAGPDKADEIVAKGEELTKELEENVKFKESEEAKSEAESETPVEDEKEATEEKPAEEKPAEENPEFVTKTEFTEAIDDVKEALKLLALSVSESTKALTELAKSDEEKVADIVEGTPTASMADMVKSVIGQDATRVDGRTKEARTGPEETPDDADMVKTGNPVVDAAIARNKQYAKSIARGGE
jgi:hypothetical protein